MGGALTSACKPHCNCGRGEKQDGSSRVNWSRQNYDVLGGSPAHVEEPLEGDIWEMSQHTKKENMCNVEDAEPRGSHFSMRKDQQLLPPVLEVEVRKESPAEIEKTAEKIGATDVDISLPADNTDAPPPLEDEPIENKEPPEEAKESIARGSAPSRGNMSFKQAVKKAMLAQNTGAKVALVNKIGVKPEGWFQNVCLELQRCIASEGRSEDLKSGVQIPQKELFARCRVACGFPLIRYYATMGLQDGLVEPSLYMVGKQDAAGKSGAFFFLSPDQQLMAKSCTLEDWNTLLKVLPDYVEYVEAARRRADAKDKDKGASARMSKPMGAHRMAGDEGKVSGFIETLLPRFLGLYSLMIDGEKRPTRILVMANVFGGALSIDRRYDMKGSTHGRISSEKEKKKKSPTFKDLDWMENEKALGLNENQRVQLMESIDLDLKFLAKHGLMDYSLLVGVHDIEEGAPQKYEAMNVITVRDQTRHCYLGIIDVLTPYVFRKRVETFLLGTIVCGRDISCQHPIVYARRFRKFVDNAVFSRV